MSLYILALISNITSFPCKFSTTSPRLAKGKMKDIFRQLIERDKLKCKVLLTVLGKSLLAIAALLADSQIVFEVYE